MINSWATDNWWSTFGQLMMTVYHIIKSWFVCLFCYLSSQVQRNEKYMINRLLFEDQQLIILWSKVDHLMINCLSDKEWCFFLFMIVCFLFSFIGFFVCLFLFIGWFCFVFCLHRYMNDKKYDQQLIIWRSRVDQMVIIIWDII